MVEKNKPYPKNRPQDPQGEKGKEMTIEDVDRLLRRIGPMLAAAELKQAMKEYPPTEEELEMAERAINRAIQKLNLDDALEYLGFIPENSEIFNKLRKLGTIEELEKPYIVIGNDLLNALQEEFCNSQEDFKDSSYPKVNIDPKEVLGFIRGWRAREKRETSDIQQEE